MKGVSKPPQWKMNKFKKVESRVMADTENKVTVRRNTQTNF
jgi:hypothetical protein